MIAEHVSSKSVRPVGQASTRDMGDHFKQYNDRTDRAGADLRRAKCAVADELAASYTLVQVVST